MDKIGVFFQEQRETSVRFNIIKKKISEICGICVSLRSNGAESLCEI